VNVTPISLMYNHYACLRSVLQSTNSLSCRVDNELNQLKNSSRFDLVIIPLNLVRESNDSNFS
jgi:hypothetical protein